VLVQILSKSWSAPFDPQEYQKQTIMKLVEELEVKDTSCGYLPPYIHWLLHIQALIMIVFCWM
jgi:hypothetical protein